MTRSLGRCGVAPPEIAVMSRLSRSWRKVASTHNLSALLEESSYKPRNRRNRWLGLLLVGAGVTGLASCVFSLVVSKLLPPLSNPALRAVQEDRYFCLLVPLTLPVTFLFIVVNWASLKLFKHNA